jgi:hypothetical protein
MLRPSSIVSATRRMGAPASTGPSRSQACQPHDGLTSWNVHHHRAGSGTVSTDRSPSRRGHPAFSLISKPFPSACAKSRLPFSGVWKPQSSAWLNLRSSASQCPGRIEARSRAAVGRSCRRRRLRSGDGNFPSGLAFGPAECIRRVGDARTGNGLSPRQQGGRRRLRHRGASGDRGDVDERRPSLARRAVGRRGSCAHGYPRHPRRPSPAQATRASSTARRPGPCVPLGPFGSGNPRRQSPWCSSFESRRRHHVPAWWSPCWLAPMCSSSRRRVWSRQCTS